MLAGFLAAGGVALLVWAFLMRRSLHRDSSALDVPAVRWPDEDGPDPA